LSRGAVLRQAICPETLLRQAIVQKAGCVEKAYAVMDVARSGAVDAAQFEAGLWRLGGLAPELGFADARAAFQALDSEGSGSISLRRFLGSSPPPPQPSLPPPVVWRHPPRFQDTRAAFYDYANRAAHQQSGLSRGPRWKSSPTLAPLEGLTGEESDSSPPVSPAAGGDIELRAKERRELRRKLRDLNNSPSRNKRTLVSGVLLPDAYDRMQKKERKWAAGQQRRIRGALDDCTKARSDLVGLQQAMLLVSEPAGRASSEPRPPSPPRPRRPPPSKVTKEVAALLRAAARQNRQEGARQYD